MRKLIREPFLHFVALGLALFLLFALVNGPEQSDKDIVIDDSTLGHIVSLWEMQWKRPPTSEELTGLVRAYIRQEVFYREALRMNLDHNDEIVKRRLSQKMEFLSDDLSAILAPATEESLRQYYDEHMEEYKTEFVYTLNQVPITSSNREQPEAFARQLLEQADDSDPESLMKKGDLILLPGNLRNVSADRLEKDFGPAFPAALSDLPVGKWSGPVPSGYGIHLVYIIERQEPRIPAFNEVRDEVMRDFEYDKNRESREAIFHELLREYNIRLEVEGLDSIKVM